MRLKIGNTSEVALYACFALYLVNIYFSRTIYVFDFPNISVAGVDVPFSVVRTLVGMLVAAAALCAYKLLDTFIRTSGAIMVAAAANLAGTTLVLLSPYSSPAFDPSLAPILSATGYALISASSTLIALAVAQLFVENRSEVKRIVLAFFAAMAINAFVSLIGTLAQALLQIALPFAIYWLRSLTAKHSISPADEPKVSRDDIDFAPLFAGYLLFIFVFSLSTSFVRWYYFSDGGSDGLLRCLTMLLVAALAGAVIYVTKRSYLQLNTIALYRATLLFFIASLCAMLIVPDAAEFAHSVQFVSDLILRMLIFVTVYRICQRYDFSPTVVLCVGSLARYCASLLFNFAEITAPAIGLVALDGIIVLLLTVIYTVVFTERNLENLTERRKPLDETSIAESKVSTLSERFKLTKRETEVARLLSQGRTVAFIADELFISPRTVSTHVTNIYSKMGIHTRQDFLDIYQQTR